MARRDIISNLPPNLRDDILTCLPLKEAVRASILSKKWKYCWINLSKLVFDDFMYQTDLLRRKYVEITNQILLLHQGPILKFSFSLSFLEESPEIDHIISFLSTSRMEEFDLKIWRGNFKLPSSFFSCRQLRHLDLYACIFNPPSEFRGFPKLIILKLVNVSLHTDSYGNFISKCPLLERLTLEKVNGSHSFEISAPNLEYLCLEEYWPLSIKSVPLLQSWTIQPSSRYHGGKHSLVELLGFMPALNKLVTNQIFLKHLAAVGVPRKLPTSTILKILQLNRISLYELDQVSSLYCLISSSPSLKRIEIKMSTRQVMDAAPVMNFLKAHNYADEVILNELTDVYLINLTGTEPEVELVKLILAKSSVLEKIQIKVPWWRIVDTELKLLKEVKRASPAAEIIIE